MAITKYAELSVTQNMTRVNGPPGYVKSMPFVVNRVESNNDAIKISAVYEPWKNTVRIETVEAVFITPEEIEAIKNPPITQETIEEAIEEPVAATA